MVTRENSVYLFLGRDSLGQEGISLKEAHLSKFKATLSPKTREFNTDTVYANDRDFTVKALQEKLLFFPAKDSRRLVIVKAIDHLKKDARDFLVSYVKNPTPGILLVLDAESLQPRDAFIEALSPYCRVIHFQDERPVSTFILSRMIDARRPQESLTILHQLLDDGEKPERIMGALRSSWLRYCRDTGLIRKRLTVLLATDLDIKTGKVKPVFALERMIVSLCGFRNLSG